MSRYWVMVHKLRKAMGNRDARYTLEGMIELDKGYFTVEASEAERSKGSRGRGAVGKQHVLVMAESTSIEDPTTKGQKDKHVRYFKAKVLDTHKKSELSAQVKTLLDERTITLSNINASYTSASDYIELHITEKPSNETTKKTLKWVHIVINNAKKNFLGNSYKIKRKYLQLYLNEFVYKLNRRYFGERLFDRLVIANITGL